MIRLEQLNKLPLFLLSNEERAIRTIKGNNKPQLDLSHITWEQLKDDSRALYEAQEVLAASQDKEELTNEEHALIELYIDICCGLLNKYNNEYIRRKTNG